MKATSYLYFIILSITLCSFVVLALFIDEDDFCHQLKSCAKCTNEIHNGTCAWCELTSECMNITIAETKCASSFLVTNCTSQQENECQDQQGCETCISLSATNGCGYCDNLGCILGNSSGPFESTCQTWLFGSSATCNTTNCQDYSDNCFGCTTQSSCGYCNSTTCVAGNETDPFENHCLTYQYNATTNTCSGQILNCSAHEDCPSCTGDESDRCGWCASSRKCLEFNPDQNNQPIDQTCVDWNPTTCIISCFDFKNCSACQENPGCGWCNDSVCTSGTSVGPSLNNMVCNYWGFDNCPYDCGALGTSQCSQCISFSDCGWCDMDGPASTCIQRWNSSSCSGNFDNSTCKTISYCTAFTNCDECTTYPQCTWCGSILGCTDFEPTCVLGAGGCNPNNNKRLTTAWIIFIIFAALILVGGAVGGVAFYKVYWTKRHYYETLK